MYILYRIYASIKRYTSSLNTLNIDIIYIYISIDIYSIYKYIDIYNKYF